MRVVSGWVGVLAASLSLVMGNAAAVRAQVVVKAKTLYTMAGAPIKNGVVVIRDGKVAAVGEEGKVSIPAGFSVLEAEVATPGLVDARATVGLTGIYSNPGHDQDQLETSAAIQPELRALDAYNPQEKLVAYVRGFGVTTVNTGHAPGKLVSGQTVVVKTAGNTVEDALVQETGFVVADLSTGAIERGKSPGTRAKMMSLLRQQLIKAQESLTKESKDSKESARDLKQEMFVRVLKREVPLLITAHRAQDIANALRLQREFGFRLILDGASEAGVLLEEIKAANVPVILHPTMQRANGDTQSLSFETASRLQKAGVPFAIQTGFEGYVPKVRVLLFEAAIAAANGLAAEDALAAITRNPAQILGLEKRVGTLEPGKDGDIALFDGDPFEYTTHCIGTVIQGKVVSSSSN
ncbi:MAG: amidohydrolase family protein [Armatimonadaceae bacterium]